jgi:hypothetical protein
MLAFNSTFLLSVIFPNSFFWESLQLAVCSTYRVSSLHTPAWLPETRSNVRRVQCCLQPCRYQSNEWPLLQPTGLCSWKTSQCSALLFAQNFCGEGRATQMSLPASDVTNRTRVPHRLQLHFVAACTACICFNAQLSLNYQGTVLLVCSINLSILLWG